MVEIAPQSDGGYDVGFAGDTFNTAWYLKRLVPTDVRIDYLTAVGDDEMSDRLIAFMVASGIGAGSVRRIADASIGLYLITLRQGERFFSYWRATSAAKRLAEHLDTLDGLARGSLVYFSGITVAILSPEGRTDLHQALARCRKAGALVVFDPNIRPRLWSDADVLRTQTEAFAATSDIVLPSFDDEASMFSDADPVHTLARYMRLGPEVCVVKNGPGNICVGYQGRDPYQHPVAAIEAPMDTTAAGDAFNAGLLAGLIGGNSIQDSIQNASAIAGKVVMGRGALVYI